jgi:hypothetical protein
MKARLLLVNPQTVTQPPEHPSYLIETEGSLYVCDDSYALPLAVKSDLEGLTVSALRDALSLRPDEEVYLSDIRNLPDERPLSPAFLHWLQDWWRKEAAQKRRQPIKRRLAKAS